MEDTYIERIPAEEELNGETAWERIFKGEAPKEEYELGELSEEHQIICITHLPQIAAMADTHFMIEKGLEDGRTVTNIFRLQGDDSEKELARLLGGDMVTDASLQNAREMRQLAKETKRGK